MTLVIPQHRECEPPIRTSLLNNTESDKGLDLPMLFIIFRFVFEQYETATNHRNKQSMILSQWLVEALELVRPVNEIMSGQQTLNEVRIK